MRVLVACEFSGVVRDAFRATGHDAWSCDLVKAEGHHRHGSVLDVLWDGWDLVIAHPPCTHLAGSGARWWKDQKKEQEQAEAFFMVFTLLKCRWAIENPIGVMSTRYRKPDQIVQPWMFGHGEVKATCLWTNNLPPLIPTNIVDGRHPRVHHESPGVKNGLTRQQRRSITYRGIAEAMASQWGAYAY